MTISIVCVLYGNRKDGNDQELIQLPNTFRPVDLKSLMLCDKVQP